MSSNPASFQQQHVAKKTTTLSRNQANPSVTKSLSNLNVLAAKGTSELEPAVPGPIAAPRQPGKRNGQQPLVSNSLTAVSASSPNNTNKSANEFVQMLANYNEHLAYFKQTEGQFQEFESQFALIVVS
jgi:hypothetical protein